MHYGVQTANADRNGLRCFWVRLHFEMLADRITVGKLPFMRKHPQTAAEWQEAYDMAHVMRMLHDCKLYGLLVGGPTIDVQRCDYLIAQGNAMGLRTSRPALDLAVAYVTAHNDRAAERAAGVTPA